MGITRNAGFTILETMLFLAITGVLIVSLLAGIGTSVNRQRYTDSVESFKSLVQEQYSDLVNVSNDQNVSSVTGDNNATPDAPWTCSSDGTVSDSGNSSLGVPRGQSNCVLLGRYMEIDAQGNITTAVVTGVQTGHAVITSDIQSLETNYKLAISPINTETSQLEWSSTLSWPISGNGAEPVQTGNRSLGILFVRSPDSGTIYTFTVDTPPAIDAITPTDLMAYIQTGNNVSKNDNGATIRGQDERVICVASGSPNLGEHMAVYLNPYASNATAVETQSNDLLSQLKSGALQC